MGFLPGFAASKWLSAGYTSRFVYARSPRNPPSAGFCYFDFLNGNVSELVNRQYGAILCLFGVETIDLI
jgi:hypothetical protein